ncbi:phage major capsid protein [Streptomyces sp. NPDC005525]|uniref:phage major capsid protein n=1 Tax=Streptomyces sp. NPDC005525 TaxID=3364720 RepID=UPI00367E3084
MEDTFMSNSVARAIAANAITNGHDLTSRETAIILRASKGDEEIRAAINSEPNERGRAAAVYDLLEKRDGTATAGATESRSAAPAEEERAEETQEERAAVQRAAMATAGAAGKVTEARAASFAYPLFSEYRTMVESTPAAGGYLVPIQQADQVYDMLRARSVVLGSGIRVVSMDRAKIDLPRPTATTAAAMVAEATGITPSDPVLSVLELKARKAAAFTKHSNELLEDSSPAAREFIAYDHAQAIGLTLDTQFLSGDGTGNNMLGIRNFAGVSTNPLGANGAQLTSLDPLIDALGRAEGNNSLSGDLVWFMSARTWATVRKLKDGQNRYQIAPDPTQAGPYSLFGIPVIVSNSISNVEKVGTSAFSCSWVGLVNKNQAVIGERRGITVVYDSSRYADEDVTSVRTTARYDIGALDSKGVELVTGILP